MLHWGCDMWCTFVSGFQICVYFFCKMCLDSCSAPRGVNHIPQIGLIWIFQHPFNMGIKMDVFRSSCDIQKEFLKNVYFGPFWGNVKICLISNFYFHHYWAKDWFFQNFVRNLKSTQENKFFDIHIVGVQKKFSPISGGHFSPF